MIIHIVKEYDSSLIEGLAAKARALVVPCDDKYVLVTASSLKEVPSFLAPYVEQSFVFPTDMQLSSRAYSPQTQSIKLSEAEIGGQSGNTLMIAGPCSAESEEQLEATCQMLKSLNVKVLRAGCYKPRTSPYSFRGLGEEGLRLLDKMRKKYGLLVATEVRDASHVDKVIQYADIVQIGAKSMYDHALLTACGEARKPVILKRGFGTTLQEFVNCADFIMSKGNNDIILCERGIRTFETNTRFTLDLCGIAWLKKECRLPVIADPSHAMGYAYGIGDLSRACVAMGVDGLLIETHPNPKEALSDAAQQLDFAQFRQMYNSLSAVAEAVGRRII